MGRQYIMFDDCEDIVTRRLPAYCRGHARLFLRVILSAIEDKDLDYLQSKLCLKHLQLIGYDSTTQQQLVSLVSKPGKWHVKQTANYTLHQPEEYYKQLKANKQAITQEYKELKSLRLLSIKYKVSQRFIALLVHD